MKKIVFKTTNGKEETVELNGTFLLGLENIGLEQIRGKEFDSRIEMYNYLETQLPDGYSFDRRSAYITYDSGVKNNYGVSRKTYIVITYKNKETKKIGITMIMGGSYVDENNISRAIRYF